MNKPKMSSDEFYEKQANLNECHTCLENAIDCLKPFDEFSDEVDYIKIALIELKKKEEEY